MRKVTKRVIAHIAELGATELAGFQTAPNALDTQVSQVRESLCFSHTHGSRVSLQAWGALPGLGGAHELTRYLGMHGSVAKTGGSIPTA